MWVERAACGETNTIQYNTIQYNTIRVHCENTLSYNNGVLSQTGPKSGSVKARQLIYRFSTNTIKLRVKKLDMEYSTPRGSAGD